MFLRDFMEDVFHTGSNLKFPAVRENGDLSKYYVVFAQNKGNCYIIGLWCELTYKEDFDKFTCIMVKTVRLHRKMSNRKDK